MSLRRTKDAATIYSEVADYDRVIVPDAPFASAINRRIERPHFGTFATTPRRLAAGRRERAEDRTAFLELIDETDHDWRAVAHAIGNVLQCWEHQGDRQAILNFDAYVDPATRDVVEALAALPTTSHWLSEHKVDPDESVAILGYDQLTQLERSIISSEDDRISLFENQSFDLPEFHIFDSKTEIVTALLDSIDAENAEHVAVVLDASSQYSSLVESAFEAAGIPFYGGRGFIDDPTHRSFVELLRACFRGKETTVGEILPVLTQMGFDVPIAHHEKRIGTVGIPALTWLDEFTDTIEDRTFGDALAEYETRSSSDLAVFARELEALGLDDQRITADGVDQLAYYLQTYEVPVDRTNEGVLLVDANSSAYVDRPVVFFLGLDDGWTRSAPQRPWVDTDAQFDRNIGQFQRLLQSGEHQYYLVQDTAGGEPVTPCLYFEDLFDYSFERFSDFPSTEHRRRPTFEASGFDRTALDVASKEIDTVSQSSLNNYVNCPRDYFFGRILDGPDRDYFLEGNLFHDFAEFYVVHTEFARTLNIGEIVELMLTEAEPFTPDTDTDLRRRKYRIGLETIVTFLDEQLPISDDFLTPDSGRGSNFFAEHYDKPIESPITERWFTNPTIGAKGKIDLVRAPDELLDYKSSSKKSEYQIVKRAAIDPPADTPNFQAILYLSHYRTVQPDTPLQFTFFHFLETLDDMITGEYDLEDTLTTVTYYPFTFDEYVGSRDAFDVLLDGYNDCQETFEELGFETYSEIMAEHQFPETTEKDELRESDFFASFEQAVIDSVPDTVNDPVKGADQGLRALNGVRKRAFFKGDVDAFEEFLQERIDELNRRRSGEKRFPVDGLAGEPNYRRVDHRDLLLAGETDE